MKVIIKLLSVVIGNRRVMSRLSGSEHDTLELSDILFINAIAVHIG